MSRQRARLTLSGTPSMRLRTGLITVALFLVLLVLNLMPGVTDRAAALQETDWSNPAAAYPTRGTIWSPVLLADPLGRLHHIWVEQKLSGENYDSIMYAVFEGGQWSTPVDVQIGDQIHFLSAVIDGTGTLHVVWSDTELCYSSVPLGTVASVQSWSTPRWLTDGLSEQSKILADDAGRLYVTYVEPTSGVYMIKSQDGGATWTERELIAGVSSPDRFLSTVDASRGPNGAIHVVWSEVVAPDGYPPLAVYYAKSSVMGDSWTNPLALGEGYYSQPSIVALDDLNILAVWSATNVERGRRSRWSNDGGVTWSDAVDFAPGVAGLSTWSPLALDAAGRVHAVIDSDSPQAILYASWSPAGGWTPISNISHTFDPETGRIVGTPSIAVLLGNQIMVTYADAVLGATYVHRVEAAPAAQPSTNWPERTPDTSTTPSPGESVAANTSATAVMPGAGTVSDSPQAVTSVAFSLVISTLIVAAFVAVVVVARHKRNRSSR